MADVPTTPENDDETVRAEHASARSDETMQADSEEHNVSIAPNLPTARDEIAGGDELRPYEGPVAATTGSPTVGVFDSGIGGFTVASAILKRRPDLNLVYYADSQNLPYGGREQAQLERFAGNIINFLLSQEIDLLADGCNTSQSALSSGELRSFTIPTYDLVSCTLESLRDKRLPESIALLATEATVRAGWWERRLTEAFPDVPVTSIAAPELVPLIEAPQQDELALRHAAGKYTRLIRETGADTVVLGCTHYALIQPLLVEADVYLRFVDPAQCLADKVAADLGNGIYNISGGGFQPPKDGGTDAAATERNIVPTPTGTLRFYNSKPSERFYAMGERVFGRPIRELTKVYIVNPYED